VSKNASVVDVFRDHVLSLLAATAVVVVRSLRSGGSATAALIRHKALPMATPFASFAAPSLAETPVTPSDWATLGLGTPHALLAALGRRRRAPHEGDVVARDARLAALAVAEGAAAHDVNVATARFLFRGGFAPLELARGGFSAVELAAAGLSAADLRLRGGFSTAQLEHLWHGLGLAALRAAGCSAGELRQRGGVGGFSGRELRAAGWTAGELLRDGFGLEELRASGVRASELRPIGVSAAECRAAGYRASEMRSFPGEELCAGGYTVAELSGDVGYWTITALVAAGFHVRELLSCFSVERVKAAGPPLKQLVEAGLAEEVPPTAEAFAALRDTGADAAELLKTYDAPTLVSLGGFTPEIFRRDGVHPLEARKAGFSAPELYRAGYAVAGGGEGGTGLALAFSPAELRAAGASAAELLAAGTSLRDVQLAGYAPGELKAEGFGRAELRAAGWSHASLLKDFGLGVEGSAPLLSLPLVAAPPPPAAVAATAAAVALAAAAAPAAAAAAAALDLADSAPPAEVEGAGPADALQKTPGPTASELLFPPSPSALASASASTSAFSFGTWPSSPSGSGASLSSPAKAAKAATTRTRGPHFTIASTLHAVASSPSREAAKPAAKAKGKLVTDADVVASYKAATFAPGRL